MNIKYILIILSLICLQPGVSHYNASYVEEENLTINNENGGRYDNTENASIHTKHYDEFMDGRVDTHQNVRKKMLKDNTYHPLSSDKTQIIDLDDLLIFDILGNNNPGIYQNNGDELIKNDSLSLSNFIYTDLFPDSSDRGDIIIHDVSIGDIDNDSRDEIVILAFLYDGYHPYDYYTDIYQYVTYLITYDDQLNKFQRLDLTIFKTNYVKTFSGHIGDISLGDASGSGIKNFLGLHIYSIYDDYLIWTGTKYWSKFRSNFAFWNLETNQWVFFHGIDPIKLDLNKNSGKYISLESKWGNFDGDLNGLEECAIAMHVGCFVYNMNSSNPIKLPDLSEDEISIVGTIRYFQLNVNPIIEIPFDNTYMDDFVVEGWCTKLIVGDFDGNGDDEFAIHTNFNLYVYDYNHNLAMYLRDQKIEIPSLINVYIHNQLPEVFLSLDVNFDGTEEILIGGFDLFTSEYWFITIDYISGYEIYHATKDHGITIPFAFYLWETTGDIDCDGVEEVILSHGNSVTILKINDTKIKKIDNIDEVLGPMGFFGPVFSGNFDGRGVKLDYTGEYELIEEPPNVLVAMAAPPTQVGISQDYANSYTSYGKEEGSIVLSSNSVGYSVSTKISLELPIGPELLGSLSASKSWKEEFTKTKTVSRTTSVGTYCAAQGDHIFFFEASYIAFKYEIIEHPLLNSLEGSHMYISVPDEMIESSCSLEVFNMLLIDEHRLEPYIGTETFNHTVGHPETYPHPDIARNISNVLIKTELQSVSQASSGFTSQIIKIQDTTGIGFEGSKSSESSVGAEFFLGAQYTTGLYNSDSFEITISSECEFEARVGVIKDPEDWVIFGGRNGYQWGLFIYFFEHPSKDISYLVINYYVEGAISYYPTLTSDAIISSSTSIPIYFGITGILLLSILYRNRRKLKNRVP